MLLSCGRLELFQYFAINILAVASGQSIIGPMNTVALAGTTVTLHCSVTTSASTFAWSYNGALICSGGVCNPPYNYSFSSTNSDLTVLCSLSVAGVYQCSPLGGFPTISSCSQLIVLASAPSCTSSPSGSEPGNITLGQSEVMSCSISYNATPSTYSPSMTWTGTPPINPINFNSSSVVNSTLTVVATSANIPYVLPYTCTTQIISLSPPPTPPTCAINIPTYSIPTYTSSQLEVLYAPFANNISITGSDILLEGQLGQAAINSTLNCSAVGYQGAKFSYIWTDPNGTNSSGAIISLSYLGSNLNYRCTATNEIGSGSNYIIVTVNTTSPSPTPVPPSPDFPWWGILLIIVVILAIIIAVLLVCFFWDRCPLHDKAPSCRDAKKYKSNESLSGGGGGGSSRGSQMDIVRNPGHSSQRETHPPDLNTNRAYHHEEVPGQELMYAELQVDNTPRSRNPVQSPAPTNEELTTYAPIARA